MNTKTSDSKLTYADAGVDIEKADQLVSDIKQIAAKTHRPGVLGNIGGFGAFFEIPVGRYKEPVLVSGTDGVGTKLKLAVAMNQHDSIGIDLVAMCVNDIITTGADPLYFLDYFATSKLNHDQAKAVMQGIANGCEQANCALIGGETAELPGVYQNKDYDLAGFCVGVVEKSKIIDATQVKIGDKLIALASSGPHANGYSLIRRVLEQADVALDTPFGDSTIGDTLLTPTRIYAKSVQALLKSIDAHAIAHITGGGLVENLPRVLPQHTQAVLDSSSWQWPDIFNWIQMHGNIDDAEMQRTFNLGVGLVIAVADADVDAALSLFRATEEHAWVIGEVAASQQEQASVIIE